MKTRSCKNKGRVLQKYVEAKVSEITGIKAGHDLDIESRTMGSSGTDLILRGKAKELFNYACECKNQEVFNLIQWIEQAKANIGNFKTWLLFIKKNKMKPMVVLEADEFFYLYQELLTFRKIGE